MLKKTGHVKNKTNLTTTKLNVTLQQNHFHQQFNNFKCLQYIYLAWVKSHQSWFMWLHGNINTMTYKKWLLYKNVLKLMWYYLRNISIQLVENFDNFMRLRQYLQRYIGCSFKIPSAQACTTNPILFACTYLLIVKLKSLSCHWNDFILIWWN
jgi:hypothetical protein